MEALRIALATLEADIERCFGVMLELRPHLSPDEFLAQVKRQQAVGYHLAYLEDDGEVRALSGYRFFETLAWGRILYIDDLVTMSTHRSSGYGSRLFDWTVAQAKAHRCAQVHLDSGVQRFGAHRFYLGKRMDITSHHFALKLDRA